MLARFSLQGRLVLLVVAATVPIALLSVGLALRNQDSAEALAQSQLKFAASLVASHQDRMIESAQQLLSATATVPGLRDDAARCSAFFENLRSRYPVYSNIGILDLQGNTLCHANHRGGAFNASDRPYFRQALQERRFVMGEALTGRSSGRLVLPFAVPILQDDKVAAVAFASLDLRQATAELASNLPAGGRVMVSDRQGRVLMQYPATQPDAGEPLLRAEAATRLVGDQGLIAAVAMRRSDAVAPAAARLGNELALLAITTVAAMLIAWWLGGRFMVKPAKRILGAVRRLEQGRLDVRVPIEGAAGPKGEFERIAAAFNLMAESLQLRRRDLEAELGHSRAAYAVLDMVTNSMQDGLIAANKLGQFLMYNRAATRLFALESAKVLPEQWPQHFGFFHADAVTLFDAYDLPLARAIRGESGECLLYVRSAVVPEGRLLQCSFQPMHREGGISGGLMVFSDVTELRRAEAELRDFTAMLQRSAEAAKVITLEHTVEAVLQVVASQAREVIGTPAAAVTLTGSGQASAGDTQALRTEPLVVPLVDRNGYRMGELSLAPVPDRPFSQHDEYVTVELAQLASIAIQNVRLLTQVQELNAGLESRIEQRTAELAQQQAQFRTLAEQAPEIVWNAASDGKVTFVNRAWCELVGGVPEQWLGHRWRKCIHPDDLAEVDRNWLRSVATREPFTGTRRFRALDGSWHTTSYRASPVLDDQDRLLFWVGIDADITGLKAIENALRASNQELEAFSYSVSHDLRAPLGAIGGFSQALAGKLEGQLDERSRHYLARIQAGVEKMEQLIDALLSLARVVRAPVEYAAVDLSDLARETFDALQAATPERRAELVVQPALTAFGDGRLLRALLDNLLGNAWKFTAQKPDARIEVGQQGPDGAFFVRDNGVGFDMAYAHKLFAPFQRLHSDKEFAGTGIGLATVQRIVTRHQGRVWAESRPGEGATFYFTLAEAAPAL